MKMYIRELFGNKTIQRVIGKIEGQKIELGKSIESGVEIYDEMMDKRKKEK